MTNFGYDGNTVAGLNELRNPEHYHHHHGKAGVAGVSAMPGPNYPVNPMVNPFISPAANVPIGPPPMVSPVQYGPGPAPIYCPPVVSHVSYIHPCPPVRRHGAFSSVGVILVLFILLIIITRAHHTL